MPKFIQITSCGVANTHATQCDWVLHALDAEGRVWEIDSNHGWREVPLPNVTPAQETCAHQHPDRKPDDTYCRDCGEHF